MLLKEICTNFEKAEQAAYAANSSLSKAEIYRRDIFIEAYNSSQTLAEYTDQMLIASRITGYAVSFLYRLFGSGCGLIEKYTICFCFMSLKT